MTMDLERRIKEVRSRAAIRAWEYRQRRHAKGVWFRLRRVLTAAAAAYIVSEEDADRLLEEGFTAEPVGRELAPPKKLIFVTPERLEKIAKRRQIAVGLGSELLGARSIALVGFEGGR